MPLAQSDWDALANEMRAIDTRVARAALEGAAVDAWAPPSVDAASTVLEGYLDRAAARLREVAQAVKRARTSTEQRIQDAADEVAGIASSATRRARGMAHELGFAIEKGLTDVESSLERGAVAFGLGLGTVLLIAYLLWQNR